MIIEELKETECQEFLERTWLGRLGCALDDQPYVVPLHFEYEPNYLYLFSTEGKKIEWMRANAKVCVEVDEITSPSEWVTVIVNGRYEELYEPQFAVERTHARELLAKQERWWLNAMAERRVRAADALVSPIFFRIRIDSLSGLRGSNAG